MKTGKLDVPFEIVHSHLFVIHFFLRRTDTHVFVESEFRSSMMCAILL